MGSLIGEEVYYGQLPLSAHTLAKNWTDLALPIVFVFAGLTAIASVLAAWAIVLGSGKLRFVYPIDV